MARLTADGGGSSAAADPQPDLTKHNINMNDVLKTSRDEPVQPRPEIMPSTLPFRHVPTLFYRPRPISSLSLSYFFHFLESFSSGSNKRVSLSLCRYTETSRDIVTFRYTFEIQLRKARRGRKKWHLRSVSYRKIGHVVNLT